MNELISVIVPVYNVEKYLRKCLDSIVNQTYKNLEIIVVVDGSPDDSLKIAKEYSKKYKNIKVFNKKNSGVVDTRRYAFTRSNGNYIAFIDSDDWLEPDYCEYLYKLLIENNADISCCSYCYNNNLTTYEEQIIYRKKEDILLEYFNGLYIKTPVWNKLYRRDVLEKFNLAEYLIANGEDVIFTCNALINSNSIVASNIQKYHYNISNISVTRSKLTRKKIDDNIFAHNKQIELIKNKYENNSVIISKAYEKLANTLINMFYTMCLEKEKNENLKYVKEIINKNYKEIISNINIDKKIKNKIRIINNISFIYVIYVKIKNKMNWSKI